MASGAEEDIVVLVLTAPSDAAAESCAHGEEEEQDLKEITISTSEIGSWDVPRILRSPVVRVRASRSRLVQESSYFRSLLGGSFSESGFSHVSIQCNLRAVVSVLQCICGCPVDVEPENFIFLLEGSLFFGVEVLLSECKTWFQKLSSVGAVHSLGISLDTVIEIWTHSSGHGISFISETCTAYLAKNFVVIDSEKQLCEALLLWITSNGQSSKWLCDSEKNYSSILKKVHVLLLPLGYCAGKRRSCYFSSIANESINAILDVMKNFPAKLPSATTDNDSNMKFRLTKYSEKIDLAGCVHLTVDLLCLAVLPSDMESVDRKQMIQTLVEHSHQHGVNYHILKKLPTTLSFKAVSELDMSKCPKLHFGALIKFLCLSFPSLQTLKLSYCSHFKIEDLLSLVQNCPLINDVDLNVDVSPVIPTQVSIFSESSEEYQALDGSPYATLQHQSVVSNIAKLTLEGRTDLDDSDLLKISALSGSLCYLNLKGCTTVTDVGISRLMQECINIQSIIVSYTAFAMNSILVLCSEKEFPNTSLGVFHSYEYSNTIAFRLQELHLDGCKGIKAMHMTQLMRCLFMLKSLSLRETCLADDAFSEYRGFLLKKLDISGTLVFVTSRIHFGSRPASI